MGFFVGTGQGLGSLMLAKVMAQAFYKAHGGGHKGEDCVGPKCFAYTHLIVSLLGLVAALSAVALSRRAKMVYQAIGLPLLNPCFRVEDDLRKWRGKAEEK